MDDLDLVNELVFKILGDDHKMTKEIKAEEPVLFTDVVFACIQEMDKRLRAIEEKRIH